MNEVHLRDTGSGGFELSGVLSFDTVPELWSENLASFSDYPELQIDLQGVSRSDSAGLALLIEWTRIARGQGRSIRFVNVPPQMLAIARVSSLDTVLPMSRSQ